MNSNNDKILKQAIDNGYLILPAEYSHDLMLKHLSYCLDNDLPRIRLLIMEDCALVFADITPLKYPKHICKILSNFDFEYTEYNDNPMFRVPPDQGEALARRLFEIGSDYINKGE